MRCSSAQAKRMLITFKNYRQFETDRDNIHAPFWDTEHIIRENSFKKEGAMWLLKEIKAGNGA